MVSKIGRILIGIVVDTSPNLCYNYHNLNA